MSLRLNFCSSMDVTFLLHRLELMQLLSAFPSFQSKLLAVSSMLLRPGYNFEISKFDTALMDGYIKSFFLSNKAFNAFANGII